ncbi:MAG: hypothetical protein K6T35_14140, partial [Meiothermus silvanus]|nr:hypothetical protein [Allomeiothermus silvanus]
VGTPPGQPGADTPDTPLSGKTRTRWKEAYRKVFGEVDGLFEARVRRAMGLMERGEARSRVEALAASRSEHLEAVRPWNPDHEFDPLVLGPGGRPVEAGRILPPSPDEEGEPGGKTAPMSEGEAQPDRPVSSNRNRAKWHEAYRTVFGEEPDGPLAEARIRAAMNFYDPGRSVGRRQALEAVRASEEEAAGRTREAGRVLGADALSVPDGADEEPELFLEDALTLGAALMKIGRLEAEVEQLRRTVARLEEQTHRTETRLGGMSPGLRALREAVREVREAVLKLGARVDTLAVAEASPLAPSSSSEERSLPPGRKELRELRARMDEERGRILLEVEHRLEEAEELM